MASDRDEAHPLGGFHSYADDRPRDHAEPPEPLAAGWSDTPAWRQADPLPEPGSPRRAVLASAAVVAVIAAGVGWSALRDPAEPPAPEPAVAAVAPASKPLEVVVVAPPPPPPIPKTSERLEVLPRPGATPARTSLAEVVIPVMPSPPPRAVTEAPPPPLPREAPSVVQAAQNASLRSAREPPRFNACRDAPTRAYEMVCSDMDLAAADRRMKRAYSAALAAGVPPGELRRDQEDWLDVREDAARVSRRAVADIYRQRTRELFAMADGRRD